jgi:hypothetical protein
VTEKTWDKTLFVSQKQRTEQLERETKVAEEHARQSEEASMRRIKLIEAVRAAAKIQYAHLDTTSFEEEEEEPYSEETVCLLWAVQQRAPCKHLILQNGVRVRPLRVSHDNTGVYLLSTIVSFCCASSELVAAFEENQAICQKRLTHARHLATQELPNSLAASRARSAELHRLIERNEQSPDMDLSEFGYLALEQARISREISSLKRL